MAVQHEDEDVRYVYLMEAHIHEELYNYRVLKKCRENPATLPKDIVMQFRVALRRMHASGVPIYVSREVESFGLTWANFLYEKIWSDRSKPD